MRKNIPKKGLLVNLPATALYSFVGTIFAYLHNLGCSAAIKAITILPSLGFASFMQISICMAEQYGSYLFLYFKIISRGEKVSSEMFSLFGTLSIGFGYLSISLNFTASI